MHPLKHCWKQAINIGKVNNQKFVQIPHAILINQIEYKLRALGVTITIREESYTSKASALDNDDIPTYKKDQDSITPLFTGKRIKRGLYKSSKGLINADIYGALNILRKETGEDVSHLACRGLVFCPTVICFSKTKTTVKREGFTLSVAA